MPNNENQPKPSAALYAIEKYLADIDEEIQKLESIEKIREIKLILQLEQELNSSWQKVVQFMEEEDNRHKEISAKNEQIIAVFEQRYSKFTDSYISYLDKTNETALSILKITVPVIPVVLAIKGADVQLQWINLGFLQTGFILLSFIAIGVVVFIWFRRKNYIDIESKKLLNEIDETNKISQKLVFEAAAKHQYANELLNRINNSLAKVALLKNSSNT